MDFRDQIRYYLNTAFKQTIEDSPYSGHSLVKFGEWSREEGFVKDDSASYNDVAVPCPVIAIVDEKIRENHLILTITGTEAVYDQDESFQQIGVTITKKTYKKGTNTVQTTLEIPRFTRELATFLISGLGNKIFEITSVTSNIPIAEQVGGGKVSFYGLASEGSKVLYYLGMFKIHNMIKEIINSIWIAPEKCPLCDGTGTYGTGGGTCPQCNGYGYSGQNAAKGIALAKGYDVKLTREKFAEYPLTDAQFEKVWKFINQAWTQKWWVTPTVSEIKRLFAHFYNVSQDDIIITERYHFSMPHWDISLPLEAQTGSPFDVGDTDLMKYIARSVTPAGVNVFVGFYRYINIGDLDDLQCIKAELQVGNSLITRAIMISSIEAAYDHWFSRYRCWNGWNRCVDNFEGGFGLNWNTSGNVDIFNANDIGRNWCRLKGNSYAQTPTGYAITNATGVVEAWVHPRDNELRVGAFLTGVEDWAFYLDFKSSGFYDHNNNLIRAAKPDCDYHIRMDFISDKYLSGVLGYVDKVYINREQVATGICFKNGLLPNRPIRISSNGVGTGFFDNFGANWVSGYTENDNWQRLYQWGWGENHLNCLSGVTNLFEKYFHKDKFFNINVSGVC